LVVPTPRKTIAEGVLTPLGPPRDVWVFSQLRAFADAYGFGFQTPWEALTDEQRRALVEGAGDAQFDIVDLHTGREVKSQPRFGGVYGHIPHTLDNTSSAKQKRWAEAFMRVRPWRTCGGGRLKPKALS